jgi:hypothetical protein
MTEVDRFDPTTIMCILTEMAKLENVELPNDIGEMIYEKYEESYKNYTLLELIRTVHMSGYTITCAWNKLDIIDMIEQNGYNVPIKKEEMVRTSWEHYRIRHSLDVLETQYCGFSEGDKIQLENGIIYDISVEEHQVISSENNVEYEVYVVLSSYEGETISVTAQEMMDMLDYDDVTIVQSRDMCYYMCAEEEEYWENYERPI